MSMESKIIFWEITSLPFKSYIAYDDSSPAKISKISDLNSVPKAIFKPDATFSKYLEKSSDVTFISNECPPASKSVGDASPREALLEPFI